MTARPPAAVFTVTPINPAAPGHTFLLGEDAPTMTREVRWTVRDRPRKVGATEYEGTSPYTLTVAAALSYLDVDRSIEDLLLKAELALAFPRPPRNEPPILRVDGPGIPPLARFSQWVLKGITPGEEARNLDGTRSLAFFTLEFLQYVPVSLVVLANLSPSQAAARRAADVSVGSGGGGGGTGGVAGAPAVTSYRTYTVQPGDTFTSIASRQLGASMRWHEIQELNPDIKSSADLRVGMVIRLPGGNNVPQSNTSLTRFGVS